MMSRIQRIDAAVDRAATIIDHMRAFGRVAGEDFAPFDVSSSIAAASDLVREPMAAKGILLSADIETTARVLGNTIQFEQVATEIYTKLLQQGIIVRPLGGYGLPNHLRVSVGLETENERFCLGLEDIMSNIGT